MIKIFIDKIMVESSGYTAIDLTDIVNQWLRKIMAENGFVTVYTPSKNCVVTLIEYEANLLSDLEEFLAKHGEQKKIVLEGLFGKSIVVPVINGEVDTGVFKRIVFIDLSEEKGSKEVVLGFEGVHQ